MQQFNTTNEVIQSKPAPASLLASINPKSDNIMLASKVSWNFTLLDEDPIYANCKLGPFDSIDKTF